MQAIRPEGLDDPKLDPFARLTDIQLRNHLEPSKGMFIAETLEVAERVFDGGARPVAMLTDERFLSSAQDLAERMHGANPRFELYALPESELSKLTGYTLHRGALCQFERPRERSVSEVVDGARLVAVLEDIRDFTNVGALFRSAAAIGVDAVLVTPGCYDPLYRRALRVSMGTVFQIPWARIGKDAGSWASNGIEELHSLGFKTAAMALDDDSISIKDERLKRCPRLALVFGTEGDGLSRSTISRCDYTVKIPMAHGVDSLNVAASSAVAFWELMRDHIQPTAVESGTTPRP